MAGEEAKQAADDTIGAYDTVLNHPGIPAGSEPHESVLEQIGHLVCDDSAQEYCEKHSQPFFPTQAPENKTEQKNVQRNPFPYARHKLPEAVKGFRIMLIKPETDSLI